MFILVLFCFIGYGNVVLVNGEIIYMFYKIVGLIGKVVYKGVYVSLNVLVDYLCVKYCIILVEEIVVVEMDCDDFIVCDLVIIGK